MTDESRNPQNDMLPSSLETGLLGVCHLKRLWAKIQWNKNQRGSDLSPDEWHLDITLLDTLGVSLEDSMIFLYRSSPTFEAFEQWILEKKGGWPDRERIRQFNRMIQEKGYSERPRQSKQVLTASDLEFWDRNGYVVIRQAIPREQCLAAAEAVWSFLGANPTDPATWYAPHPAKQGIMVQLFHHPALEINRQSEKIRDAYAQLWGTSDLVVNTDRVSFNPPKTPDWQFPGPGMHWDVRLIPPIPFGLQGLLYLSDTRSDQGAFRLSPGFHKKIDNWLLEVPEGSTITSKEVEINFGSHSIEGHAGDFIIWHQALPHGSQENHAEKPRIVQYINWKPLVPANQVNTASKPRVTFSWT